MMYTDLAETCLNYTTELNPKVDWGKWNGGFIVWELY
jgi:hypothetical protein